MKPADETRPDPDVLLRRLQRAEERGHRGRLRIYLGASPGVGKTFAMLNEGKRRAARGADVVAGFVETYGRPLTMEAAEGLELIPRKAIAYQGVTLEEMDVPALLRRRPAIALVDELAHTNAPGSTHEKRYQDVEELLAAGINVITTLNIQHLESLNDVVAGITGVRVRETVPDSVIDGADEVELVDVSPEALRSRMTHGNIYPPAQAERALGSFFRLGNLTALRQLALQRVALEVEQQLGEYMHEHGLTGWESGERVLVLVDNTPSSEVAIRRAWRLAHALNESLLVVYPAPLLKEQGMTHILTVAADLNAETIELPGVNLERELLGAVKREHAGHVVLIVQPARRRSFRSPPLADRLLSAAPGLDLHLVGRLAPKERD